MFRKILFHLLWFLFFYVNTSAQIWDYSFTHYTKEDGLPSNTIYGTTTDNDGILWIGTDAGLVKFDGSHFKTYTVEDGLPSNEIFELMCDSRNRIWITSMGNSVSYVYKDKVYTNKNDSVLAKIKVNKRVIQIVEIKNKGIFIATFPFEIYSIYNNAVSNYTFNKIGCQIANIQQINNQLYITSSTHSNYFLNNKFTEREFADCEIIGLIVKNDTCYYIEKGELKKKKFTNNNFNSTFTVWSIFSDKHNNIWQITNNGIIKYNMFDLSNKHVYLKNESVSYFHNDDLNNNWVSTLNNGLFNIKINSVKTYKIGNNKLENKFKCIKLFDNKILIGTERNVFAVLNKKLLEKMFFFKLDSNTLNNNRILKIEADNNGNTYISSDIGHFKLIEKSKRLTFINNLACKNNYIIDNISYVLTSWGILKYDLTNSIVDSVIYNKRMYSYAQHKGEEIVGCEDGLYSFKNKVYSKYPLNISMNNCVMDILSHDSMIILATVNSGVYFIKNHKIVHNLTSKNGLSSNNCFKIKFYKNNYYIATSNGISIYNFQTNVIKTLFEGDGLASNTVNDIVIESDTLYAATDNGLSVININEINYNKNFILYNKPTIVGTDTLWTIDTLFDTRTDKPFRLFLNSLSYSTKGNVEYFYRYLKNDTAFQSTSDQQIDLQFKKHGNYIFEVYALDANRNKSNTIKIYINVKPYFWQTWLFKIIVGITLLSIIYYLLLLYSRKIKAKAAAKQILEFKIQSLENSAWRSKINPHFLFNSLNSVNALIKTERYPKAVNYIDQFSSILRQTIEHSNKILNTIEDETNYIRDFLTLELIKRENQLQYTISFSNETLKKYYIPALILQPVIENSLKHGIKAQKNGLITIEFFEEENVIRCVVTDNGEGSTNNTKSTVLHKSFGLKLIEEKISIIESIVKQKISYQLTFKYPEIKAGAISTFIFPIIKTNDYDSNADN